MFCFQVLTGCEVEWVPASSGQVPDGALPSGETEDGEPLFVGRTSHEGTRTLGKVYCVFCYMQVLHIQLPEICALLGNYAVSCGNCTTGCRVISQKSADLINIVAKPEIKVNTAT